MKVLVVEPYYAPYEKEIGNELRDLQAIVGGLIEPIYPYEEMVALVCNEEGLLKELPFNRSVEGGYEGVFGTFFICGLNEEEFCSLSDEQIQRFKKKFYKAEILLGIRGNKLVTMKVDPKEREKPEKSVHGTEQRER